MAIRTRIGRIAIRVAVPALLAGCTVGPDYHRPEIETPASWSPSASAAFADRVPAQVEATPVDAATWWTVFDDPVLTRLIELAQAQNLDVQSAAVRIGSARAQLAATKGEALPSVDASVIAGRTRTSDNGFTRTFGGNQSGQSSGQGSSNTANGGSGGPRTTFNLFQVGFDATWELDFFGRVQRSVEAAEADVRGAVEARNAVFVSLAAEVARDYFELRANQQQLAIAQADLATQLHLSELVASRNRAGLVSSSDVTAQTVEVAATRAQLPPLEQRIAQTINQLSLLLALPPNGVAELVKSAGEVPSPPARAAIGLSSDLLRRRPDIRQREAALASATARIGVATARLFPSVRLGLIAGLQSITAASLFDWASRFFIGGTQISLPIFEGGQLRAQVRIAEFDTQQAVLAYRQTVLTAFHDTDNALIAYADEQRRLASLEVQHADALRSRALAEERYRNGLNAFIEVLNAERRLHQTERTLAESRAAVATNLVALYKALGGGWDEADEAEAPATTAQGAPEPTQPVR